MSVALESLSKRIQESGELDLHPLRMFLLVNEGRVKTGWTKRLMMWKVIWKVGEGLEPRAAGQFVGKIDRDQLLSTIKSIQVR